LLHGKLLRADNAPYILAFIADVFADEGEIPFSPCPRANWMRKLSGAVSWAFWETKPWLHLSEQWISAGGLP